MSGVVIFITCPYKRHNITSCLARVNQKTCYVECWLYCVQCVQFDCCCTHFIDSIHPLVAAHTRIKTVVNFFSAITAYYSRVIVPLIYYRLYFTGIWCRDPVYYLADTIRCLIPRTLYFYHSCCTHFIDSLSISYL